MHLFGQQSVKKASKAQDENSGWDPAEDSILIWSWILYTSSEHNISCWLAQNAFPFHLLFSFNMDWTERIKKNIFNARKCLIPVHLVFKKSGDQVRLVL